MNQWRSCAFAHSVMAHSVSITALIVFSILYFRSRYAEKDGEYGLVRKDLQNYLYYGQ